MNVKRTIKQLCALVAVAIVPFTAMGGDIDANAARITASHFLKSQASSPTLKTAATADLKLVYAEPSAVKSNVADFYAFNITGGGFVIVAGEDRANQVLGYSDNGSLDFSNLPINLRALLDSYKVEIEYLQAHPELKVTPALRTSRGVGVSPLIRSHWGQEMPYYLQCPTYQGEYCVVGCVATAMSQVMHYWQYPTHSPEVKSFYCYSIGQTLSALPETTFEYNKMLNSYCHWDYDQNELVQDTYTDEQAQAVAKLARYCGQAVRMSYSPDGSGAYVSDQLSAMISFGFSDDADQVSKESWWGTLNYTTEEWEAMVKTELDAGRPILYSASDINGAGGHAFVCDGYNAEGLLHFNFGWYGTCDGWYVSTALNMTHRSGEVLKFNTGHEMLIGVVPPSYCVISTDPVTTPSDLLVLGESMEINASNVRVVTTNDNVNILFALQNAEGRRLANSKAVKISLADFEQGSDLSTTMTLPANLEQGSYSVLTYYYISNPRLIVSVNCDEGTLNVIGHCAKLNAPFTISDVTTVINYLLNGTYSTLHIDDVTAIINVLLTNSSF